MLQSKLFKLTLTIALIVNLFIGLLPMSAGANEVQSVSGVTETQLPEAANGGQILHAWNMSFREIKRQLPYIAAAGFNTIQTSPIGESLFQFPHYHGGEAMSEEIRSRVGTWWMLYQPVSFEIGNMLGTEEEFAALTAAAAEFGIGIIVDAVPNHMTSWWYEIAEELRRPELFHSVPGDGSSWDRNISQWNNRAESRRARLLGLIDFYTGNSEFQELYKEFLGRIIDLGAIGFRYDAMVHIELPYPYDEASIASDFWPNIQSFVDERVKAQGRIPFQYGEILHRWHADYIRALPGMSVTACPYGYFIRNHVLQGRLNAGNDRWDTTNFLTPGYVGATADRFVTWIESHDTYGNAGISRGLSDNQIRVGWAILTARYGTTPLFLVRPGSGFVNDGQMFYREADGTYTNLWGHSDMFRDSTIVELNWFSNYFQGTPERTTDHFNQVALIERGEPGAKTGVVIVNTGDSTREVNFPVDMVDGKFIDQVSGQVFTVENGYITGPDLLPQGVAVIYGTEVRNVTPTVFASPGSSTFLDPDGVTVTLGAHHTTNQYFTVSLDGEVVIPLTAFVHGEAIVVGQGATPDDVFELTLIGFYGEKQVEAIFTYRKLDPTLGIRIEFAYDAWELVRIWGWHPGGGNLFMTDWNNAPLMTWDQQVEAWVYTLPIETATPFNVMFHNGAGTQLPTGPPYWLVHGSTRIELVDGQPVFIDIDRTPTVSAEPGSSYFYTDAGVTVTLNARNTDRQTFMVTDPQGLVFVNATDFKDGHQLTIGARATPGSTYTLRLDGFVDGELVTTEFFRFTRGELVEELAGTRIEFVPEHPWTNVQIWGWHTGGGNIFAPDTWATAPTMTWDEKASAFVFDLGGHIDLPVNLMFHNGQGQQTGGFIIEEATRIEFSDNQWVLTPIVPEEVPYVPTIVEIEFEIYVRQLPGRYNELIIVLVESLSNGTSREPLTKNFDIRNNASGYFEVGNHVLFVNTQGNTQIREARLIES